MVIALDRLAATSPTEYGGPNADSGFAYQHSWTVCKLIELHQTTDDYLVICDYHDDVVVLEGGMLAEKVDFYQVKTTRKKPWTVTRLIKKGKSEERQPIAVGCGQVVSSKRNI